MASSESRLEAAKKAARRVLIQAGALSFFVNMLMLTGPLYMLQIYDRVLSSRSLETLAAFTLLTLGLFAAMGVIDLCRSALLARTGDRFERDLKDITFDRAMDAARLGAQYPERPMRDLRQIRLFVASPALTAVFDAPWTPIFLLIVFLMHWLLGVVALIGAVCLLILASINGKVSHASNAAAQGLSAEADQLAAAALRNAAATDAMGMRKDVRARWRGMADAGASSALTATDRIGGLSAASRASRLFLQSAILGTGAFLAVKGIVTPGVMIAASIIAGRALAPIEVATSQWRNFSLSADAYLRIKKFIGDAPATAVRTPLPAPSGALVVDKIYCQPGTAKKPVLKNISFQLGAGEALGVIGPSAAGKSTLARALVGVERIVSGEVRLDSASIAHWDPDALGQHIGYLPQEAELFGGTPAQNIARFSPDDRPDDIIKAAKAAGAHEMICALPDGYDTEIGDRGARLSAGQRQRLGLARALFGDPAIIVLDEPNANLDADGDAALAAAVQDLKTRGATVIVVAHRPSGVAFVDKLILIVEGEVRALGPRDEILKQFAPRQVAPFPTADVQAAMRVNRER